MRYRVIYFQCLSYLALPLCTVSMHLTRCVLWRVVCLFCLCLFLVFEAAIYANKDAYIARSRVSCHWVSLQRNNAGRHNAATVTDELIMSCIHVYIQCTRCTITVLNDYKPWAFAHRGKWVSWKMDKKLKSENIQKSSFLCLCYILRAIRAGRCRERRYADHIFIHIYFIMHHFVVKFCLPQAAKGHYPLTKILRTFLL